MQCSMRYVLYGGRCYLLPLFLENFFKSFDL
jgi:hypothetical protein